MSGGNSNSPNLLGKIPNITTESERPVNRDTQLNPYTELKQTLYLGMVVDVIAGRHCYVIQRELGANVLASALMPTGTGPLGQQSHTMYPPGTTVLVYHTDPSSLIGCIIGAMPRPRVNYGLYNPDWLLEGSTATYKDDDAHRIFEDFKGSSNILDFGLNRPIDTRPGEFGYSNALGLGLVMGMSHIMLRATGLAQFEAFYLDHLVRITGYNYELNTAVTEHWSGDDEGEISEITYKGLFPWEMKGLYDPDGNNATKEGANGENWEAGKIDAAIEPLEDDQIGVFRLRKYGGFLGDLERIQVTAPVSTNTYPEKLSGTNEHLGLSETVRHANGMLEIRSRKGILLEKSTFIPIPHQKATPDDPAGDSAREDNYKFSGQYGTDGNNHDKSEATGDYEADFQLQAFELLSLMHQSYGLQSFRRHAEDWRIPEEAQSAVWASSSVAGDYATPAGTDAFSAPPTPFELEIDPVRDHKAKYYRGRSMVYMADNGGVLLEDSWGSQVEMFGGNIKITCAGDLTLAPGRNLVTLAGNDAITRAHKHVDISAGDGDVRIKAQNNFYVLAGNDGKSDGSRASAGVGSILMETRGQGHTQEFADGTDSVSAGIILKTEGSPILCYGDGIYMRSRHLGDIVLDADSGNGTIQMYGRDHVSFLSGHRLVLYNTDPVTRKKAESYEYVDSNIFVSSQKNAFVVNASTMLHTGDSFDILGSARVVKDFSARSVATNLGGSMGQLRPTSATKQINLKDVYAGWAKPHVISGLARPALNSAMPYSEDGVGTTLKVDSIGFSMRTEAQYGVDFKLSEARWQYYQRIFSQVTSHWEEPVVFSPTGTQTLPYPGWSKWTNAGEQFAQQLSLFHWDKDTGEKLDENNIGAVTPVSTSAAPDTAYITNPIPSAL